MAFELTLHVSNELTFESGSNATLVAVGDMAMPNVKEFVDLQPITKCVNDKTVWTKLSFVSDSPFHIFLRRNTAIALKIFVDTNTWTNYLWQFSCIISPKEPEVYGECVRIKDLKAVLYQLCKTPNDIEISILGFAFNCGSDGAPKGLEVRMSLHWNYEHQPSS